MKKLVLSLLMGLSCGTVVAASNNESINVLFQASAQGVQGHQENQVSQNDQLQQGSQANQDNHLVQAMNLIMDMYNNQKFENSKYLEAHSTSHLLEKLAESYEYDCPQGDKCYDASLFRSGAQDGASNKSYVTHIQPLGNGWYEYHFLDMGHKGSKKIKIIEKNGKLYFDDVQ